MDDVGNEESDFHQSSTAPASNSQGFVHDEFPISIDDWVANLARDRIHPVLVFGTSFSGKTTMLESLLAYAMHTPNVGFDISRGEPLFPNNKAVFMDRNNDGVNFYDTNVTRFSEGELPPHTAKKYPFFVPVDIVVKGQKLRFAFLEGNGEWFERKTRTNPEEPVFEPFKTEIIGLIKKFKHPLSVIFVAPAEIRGEQKQRVASYEAVANCVDQYKKELMNRQNDNLLLLITKWDLLCDPSDRDSRFADASAAEVVKRIAPWRFIWTKFIHIPTKSSDAKAFMPYSAGWITGTRIKDSDESFKKVFDKFNRTLWNWLYGNAMIARSENKKTPRPVLYADVDPKPRHQAQFYLNCASRMLWIRPRSPETK